MIVKLLACWIWVAYLPIGLSVEFQNKKEILLYVHYNWIQGASFECTSDQKKWFGVGCRMNSHFVCPLKKESYKTNIDAENDCLKSIINRPQLIDANITMAVADKTCPKWMQSNFYDRWSERGTKVRKVTIDNKNLQINYSVITNSEKTFYSYVGANEEISLDFQGYNDYGYIHVDDDGLDIGYPIEGSRNKDLIPFKVNSTEYQFYSKHFESMGYSDIGFKIIYKQILLEKNSISKEQAITVKSPCYTSNTIFHFLKEGLELSISDGQKINLTHRQVNVAAAYNLTACMILMNEAVFIPNDQHPWNNETKEFISTKFPQKAGSSYFNAYNSAFSSNIRETYTLENIKSLINEENLVERNHPLEALKRTYYYTVLCHIDKMRLANNEKNHYRFRFPFLTWEVELISSQTRLMLFGDQISETKNNRFDYIADSIPENNLKNKMIVSLVPSMIILIVVLIGLYIYLNRSTRFKSRA